MVTEFHCILTTECPNSLLSKLGDVSQQVDIALDEILRVQEEGCSDEDVSTVLEIEQRAHENGLQVNLITQYHYHDISFFCEDGGKEKKLEVHIIVPTINSCFYSFRRITIGWIEYYAATSQGFILVMLAHLLRLVAMVLLFCHRVVCLSFSHLPEIGFCISLWICFVAHELYSCMRSKRHHHMHGEHITSEKWGLQYKFYAFLDLHLVPNRHSYTHWRVIVTLQIHIGE